MPFLILLFACLSGAVLAQTSEPIQYMITEPTGVSVTLSGTLTLPADLTKPIPVVLLIAGSGPTDRDGNSPAKVGDKPLTAGTYRILADSLVRQGIAVVRYDKRFSGSNMMPAATAFKMADFRFDRYVDDAVGFIRQLQADKRFSRVIVAGHSEGSLVGILAATRTNAYAFVSLSGAGHNIADVLKKQLGGLPATQRERAYRDLDSLRTGQRVQQPEPAAMMLLAPTLQPYMMSWMKYDPAVEIRKFRGPVLIVNGKRDLQVGVAEAEALKAARPDARMLLYPDMTHALKNADSDSPVDNLKTYHDPELPITPGLAEEIARIANRQ